MPVERNEGMPYRNSGTLKKKLKRLTGKLPSPTVTRKHGDATTETDGGGAGQGHVDKQVTIRKHSKEQLEAEGKTVGVHLQYMQVFFKDLGNDSKDYSKVPDLTDTILVSVRNFLDVINTLLRGINSEELQSDRQMAFSSRNDLLQQLAGLVRWADSLYLSEFRRSFDADPFVTHIEPLVDTVKNLVTSVSRLCSAQEEADPNKSITRMRHRSLPSAKLEMFLSSTTQSLPRRTAISRSTENILELESPKPKRNAMTSSESEGQISRLRRNPDQSLTTSSIQSNFNLSPRMSRKDRSPLAHSYQSGSMGSSADQLSDVSVDSLNEPTDTSSGSSPNPPKIDNEEEEKPPPLPIKKRNSIPTDGDISVVDRPGFLPLYMDDRARMQMGLTGHDSGADMESRAPLQAKYSGNVGMQLINPAFRKSAERGVTKRGPMKATVDVLGGMNGVQTALHACLPDNHTAMRRQQVTGHQPVLLSNAVPDGCSQPPAKPSRQRNSTSSKPTPVNLSLNISSVSDTSTLDDSSSIVSLGSDSTLNDNNTPQRRTSLPGSPIVSYARSPSMDLTETMSPPAKPPRPSTGALVRPAKPPRPPTPVKLPDQLFLVDGTKPPPLPLKKKQQVPKYFEIFNQQQNEHAEDEYDPLQFYQSYQLEWPQPSMVDWNTLNLSPGLKLNFDAENTDKAPPLPVKKKTLSSRGRTLSVPCDTENATLNDSSKCSSEPNVLDSVTSVQTSDSEDAATEYELSRTVMVTPLDKLEKELLFNEGHESGTRVLRGGSVDALIACACAAKETGPEGPYFEAFLMTYRTFVTSETVLEKLLESHDFYLTKSDQVGSTNTLSLLMRVVDYLSSSELNQEMTDRLIDVVYRLLCSDELKLAVVLRLKLMQKWKSLHELKDPPANYLMTKPDPTSRARKITEFKSRQLAEQMTLLDMKFFQNIEAHEMLLWAEEQNEERNPSLTAFTGHFNNVSGWCRTRLIESKDSKEREKVALKLLKVMRHLKLMNNFNSYLAILSAMDSAAISRLDWSDEVVKGLEEPHALIDNTSSFKAYRTALREAKSPCIPYIGMFLQDLTFLHLGSPSFLDKNEKKFVNFTKRWKQFNVLKKIRQCQQVEYQFERDETVVQVFNKFENYLGDEQIYQRSLLFKPRQF
ncbi:uncharacterized protein LOC134190584 isoform X2 [Corticium candelabrum]|uniref:uncharacterized protein LOC134190584 isoform X2 n=1 Tax=Corticium candelabrum TaxID=121492 RepID=UPI002E275936|nr:uncharacterized protein LOC134190584 isoform X2 [Corticium candelabrum]